MVFGSTSSLNAALITVLAGTPAVGPGVVVAGVVRVTVGSVVSALPPVVKPHAYGADIERPVAILFAPLTVALYGVSGNNVVPGVSVKLAVVLSALSTSVPAASMQGAAQVSVKLEAPVNGCTGSLNAADTTVSLIATPVARLTGATAVTAGPF